MFERFPAIELFHQLQVEQTTPTGTVVFLAVMVAVFMLGAIALYAAAMTVIWYLRFRGRHTPLHRVFLPSAEQFREHAAEYSLALATSIVLMLSLMAKHTTVEHLKTALGANVLESAQDCRTTLDVGHLFPLHTCPQQLANVGVVNLLQLTAEQGQTNEAEFVVERLYRDQQKNDRLPGTWLTEERLRLACLVLLLAHVLWLVRGRSQALASNPDGGETVDYGEAARPLLALSVCAALLLLAAPAVLPTAENVASATIASIQDDAAHNPEASSSARAQVEAAFENQRHNLGLLDGNTGTAQDESLFAVVSRVRQRVDEVDVTLRAEDGALRERMTSLDETHRRDIDALRADLTGNRDRLMAMDTTVQSQASGIRDLQEQLTKAQAALQAGIGTQQARLSDLQQALAQARSQIDQAVDTAQSTRDTVMKEVAGNISQLQMALQRLNTQVAQQLQSTRADLTNDIRTEAQARAQLASRLSVLEQSGGNLGAVSQQIAAVARDLNTLTARVNSYHPNVITRGLGVRDIVKQPAGDPGGGIR